MNAVTRKSVLIIDDEPDARMLIRQYLAAWTAYSVVGESDNGIKAVIDINLKQPDLVFLDIKMPGLNGFEVVQELTWIPQIIFTTAYDEFAMQAFEANAIDYLLKPYTGERFNKSMAKLAALTGFAQDRILQVADQLTQHRYPARLLVENGNRYVNIAPDDILYIEAERDYAKIVTEQKSYLSNNGIGILEQRLNPEQFTRIHRSYIVNIQHVKELHREGSAAVVLMKNGASLNVSRTYLDGLKKWLY